MRKRVKRTLKSFMLAVMALVTATATLVSASSYSIIVEHIWEDNNNAYGTRPDNVSVDITQVTETKTGADGNKTQVDAKEKDKQFGTIKDDGSSAGKEAGENKDLNDVLTDLKEQGKTDAANAAADAQKELEKLNPVKPEDLNNPDTLTKPEDLKQPEDLEDYTGSDGQKYIYSEAEKNAYKQQFEAYREAYEKYVNAEDQKAAYEAYEKEYNNLKNFLIEQAKAENTSSRPGGNDDGFRKGFAQSILDAMGDDEKAALNGETDDEKVADIVQKLEDAYKDGLKDGLNDVDTSGTSVSDTLEANRDALVSGIDETIKGHIRGDQNAETAKKIYDKITEILKGKENEIAGTDKENKWSETLTTDKDGNELGVDDFSNGLNYRADVKGEVEAKTDFLKDTLKLTDDQLENIGYKTTPLKIEIYIVNSDRVYFSVDKGETFVPVDDSMGPYDPATDVINTVKFTFLHQLAVPDPVPPEIKNEDPPTPPSVSSDPEPTTPPPPEEVVEEPPVPLAEPEEPVEEEEIPEEEVPQTEIPKTGDNSGLWMGSALISGVALLALLRKRDEDAEAEEA